MRQKTKAHCSIHTCAHTACSPFCTPQATPVLASKWHRQLQQTSFLLKNWNSKSPVFHLATVRRSFLPRSNGSEPQLPSQLFWLLFSLCGHSAPLPTNPEGRLGHRALQVFLEVTLVSLPTAFLLQTTLSLHLQLFLAAILTAQLSLLRCAVTVMKCDVRNSGNLLPHHFLAPVSKPAAFVSWGRRERQGQEPGAGGRGPA